MREIVTCEPAQTGVGHYGGASSNPPSVHVTVGELNEADTGEALAAQVLAYAAERRFSDAGLGGLAATSERAA